MLGLKKIIIFMICVFILFAFLLPTVSPYQLNFKESEEEFKTAVDLAFVGDILMMEDVQKTAQKSMNMSIEDPYRRVASGFESCFSDEVVDCLSSADLAFGNLENPIAEGLTEEWYIDERGRPVCEEKKVDPGVLYDGEVYRFNPKLIVNAHPALAYSLKNVGFDVVSTSNNHYANRASNGIDKTIDSLRRADLDYVGTLKNDEIIDENNDGYPDNQAYITKNVDGVKVGFLAFTSQINHMVGGLQFSPISPLGMPYVDKFCSRQVYSVLSIIQELVLM